MKRYDVGVLGATGLVGQRLIERLVDHPWFRIAGLAASDRSAGKPYGEAVSWRIGGDPPAAAAALTVGQCRVEDLERCDLVLSALDSDVAREVEPSFARAGFAVVSNSSTFRMAPDVPLMIPEVNADHVAAITAQQAGSGDGFIVTNPNCSVTGLAVALAPLHRAFGLRRAVVVTLQALSGAGVTGPRALDMLDNVVPFIPGEEDKLEQELRKILGELEQGSLSEAAVTVSAHCHRVSTVDGHLEAVSLELEQEASPERVIEALRDFRGPADVAELPTARRPVIEVRDEPDRPQPRLDRDRGDGMTVVVGRIRRCPVLGVKLELLSHNAVRGAAGATLLNAELLAARGLLPSRNRS